MIKPNELICGNTLHYLTAEGDVLPTTIDWQDIQWISENEKDFNTVHRPIQLTEDWLKRFGFERLVGWLDVWRKDGFDRFELTEIHDEYFFNDTKIEFVHQLQNAFFCIEQTELTPSDGGKIE